MDDVCFSKQYFWGAIGRRASITCRIYGALTAFVMASTVMFSNCDGRPRRMGADDTGSERSCWTSGARQPTTDGLGYNDDDEQMRRPRRAEETATTSKGDVYDGPVTNGKKRDETADRTDGRTAD